MCSMSSAALELIAKARELALAMMLEGDGGAFVRLLPYQRVIFSNNHPKTLRGKNENTLSSCPYSAISLALPTLLNKQTRPIHNFAKWLRRSQKNLTMHGTTTMPPPWPRSLRRTRFL